MIRSFLFPLTRYAILIILIDRVIIVDNGELLLNASIAEISEKLCFKTVSELSYPDEILYSEDSLKGYSVVIKKYRSGRNKNKP